MTDHSPAAKPYIVAADIGTTSTKTLIIDREGRVKASHSIEYPLFTPTADRAEQDPQQIFQAVVEGIGAVVRELGISAEEVLCVSFSSAMHSLIAVDDQANPLTQCVTWADNRSAVYVEELKRSGLGQQIYSRTGTPIHPMSPLLKLMWFRDNEPDLVKRTYKFIGIKEFVFVQLFDRYIIDHSLASATGLFNLQNLDWDEEALRLAGVTRGQLSELVPTTFHINGLRVEHAAAMGLSTATPFVVGASDGVLANLGVGAIEPGVVAVTIGTSGAVRSVVNKPQTDPEGKLFCYALTENFWVVGGPINNGGIVFRWVRDQIATLETEEARRIGMDPYDYLTELASQVQAGSDGLLFLPLLAGERAPYWNANARGVYFGLSLNHQKKHMIRAALEGVMFSIQAVASSLERLMGPATELRASGGFARSAFWRQMMADMIGTSVTVPDAIESSGVGAALLGLLAMGEIEDLSHAHNWIQVGTAHEVNESDYRIYQQLTSIYTSVYHQLKDQFDAITAFQQQHLLSLKS
ncbi:gluconokinase [Paenibacillus sp. SYP-B3998]|uniref:Gluconokinase n=1 Tax=Paenibacillus sp. SYP-B3998 TaxID=2678564 RepID=A0A6G3ZTD7_9BACL|nr:gluconokinase [Paenibacillus sp. SYP-B3998]NEW05402.1 gluconokinase [Paenibacillus sp. SYP-B3998]